MNSNITSGGQKAQKAQKAVEVKIIKMVLHFQKKE